MLSSLQEPLNKVKSVKMYWSLILLLSLLFQSGNRAVTEEGQLLNLQFHGDFSSDHLDELITFMFNSSENIPVLHYQIQNPSENELAEYLIETRLTSDFYGVLLYAVQEPEDVIVLQPDETVRFSNLDIINGKLPDGERDLKFDFILSSSARNILSSLNAGALVSDDNYTVEVKLFRKTYGISKELIATESISFETNLPESELAISNDGEALRRISRTDLRFETPLFQWSGLEHLMYRLIVVKKSETETTEQLLNNRFEQPHSREDIADTSRNVYLDVITTGNSFRYPEELAEVLEQGEVYAWQVRANVKTTQGEKKIESDIWDFTTERVDSNELTELLTILLGTDKVEQFLREGLELDKIELDGTVYTASEAIPILQEMVQKIQTNRAVIGE
jgi:hypothetical protein